MPGLLSRGRHVAPAPDRVPWRSAFAVREFRGLFIAYLASLIGDQLAKIALAILVFDRTNNAFLGSATYAVTFLPALIAGPLLGWTADRLPRREVMIACDLGRAALIVPMLTPGLGIPTLLALLFAVSALEPPFVAARSALMLDVLQGKLYPIGQSLTNVSFQVSQVVGFAAGGALVAVLRPRGALVVDCVTFLASASIIVRNSPRRPARDVSREASWWALIGGGAVEVFARRELRQLLALTATSFALIIATEGLAVSYAAEIGRGSLATGFLTAAVPLGSAVGLALILKVRPSQQVVVMRVFAVFWALPLVATALHPPVTVTFALWAVAGFLGSFQLVANVMFAAALKTENRGRVFAFAQSLLIAVQGLGLSVAGLVARLTSPSTAVAVAGLTGILACGVLSLRFREAASSSSAVGSSRRHGGR